jgi:hypothetical protein
MNTLMVNSDEQQPNAIDGVELPLPQPIQIGYIAE